MYNKPLLFLVCVVLAFGVTHQTSAQSLTIDPLLIERSVSAGSSITYTVNVQNESPFELLTLVASVADVSENTRGVYELAEPGTSSFSLAEWVTFQPSVLTIQPASSGRVTVTITIPRGVSGGRYGAIVLAPREDVRDPGAAPYTYRMASFIELAIEGAAVRKEAFISDFSVSSSEEWPTLRTQVGDHALVYSAEVTNAGNIHVTTKGTLSIRTPEGRTIANYPLGGGRGLILPESTVRLQSVTGANLPSGTYVARAVIEYGGRRPMVSEIEFEVTESQIAAKEQEAAALSRFVVEPDELEAFVRAGAMSSSILELTNRGSDPIEVTSRILPLEFSILGEFLPEEERGDPPDWITVNPPALTLQPGRTQKIRLTIRPPKDADGGYYADLIFESATEGGTTESGSSILVFVGDTVERAGSIEIVNIEQHPEYLVFDALFTNMGNYHLTVGGDFALSQVFESYIDEETGRVFPRTTELISSIAIPTSLNPVLPGKQRAFSFQVPTTLGAGDYEISIRVDYGGDEPALIRLPFRIEREDESVE